MEEKERRRKDGRKKRRAEGDHRQRAATTTQQDAVSQPKSNGELEKMDRKKIIAERKQTRCEKDAGRLLIPMAVSGCYCNAR